MYLMQSAGRALPTLSAFLQKARREGGIQTYEKVFFDIQWDACNDLARTLFMKTSGIDREGSKFERMKKMPLISVKC